MEAGERAVQLRVGNDRVAADDLMQRGLERTSGKTSRAIVVDGRRRSLRQRVQDQYTRD